MKVSVLPQSLTEPQRIQANVSFIGDSVILTARMSKDDFDDLIARNGIVEDLEVDTDLEEDGVDEVAA